ncbi:hypothetical protein [Butyrivibrio sp. XPD2002]|uniref:hypothetical protein n=1 Tax=Butyrivibrio sp. XPD2002 TaxID=1280665 RepID=UPI00042622BB|nr:hypothetical protein [Butyrivibrio sp. XPD2002]
MATKRESYDNEILNLRAFYLVLLKKIWIIPVAAVIGAIVAGIIYFLANVVYAPARNYVTESTLYITFAYDENKGTEVDFYNAYTWNLLVKAEDQNLVEKTDYNILDGIMEKLDEAGYHEGSDVTREEVIASVNADIPSDVRVMIFTVSNPKRELSGAIADAANAALVEYGKNNEAFTQIKLLGRTDTKMELIPDKMAVAVIFGAVLGFVFAILVLLFSKAMDDAVYVPEDVERRYNLPVLGVLTSDGVEEPSFFRNELLFMFREKLKNEKSVALISADDRKGSEKAEETVSRLKSVIGNGIPEGMAEVVPMTLPGNSNDSAAKLSSVDGAVIAVSMGTHNGAMTEHLISLLRKLGCNVCGIVITDADIKLLNRYLGL